MPERVINEDEWYPVLVPTKREPDAWTRERPHEIVDIPESLLADYKHVKREFKRVQKRLRRLLDAHQAETQRPVNPFAVATCMTYDPGAFFRIPGPNGTIIADGTQPVDPRVTVTERADGMVPVPVKKNSWVAYEVCMCGARIPEGDDHQCPWTVPPEAPDA